MAVINTNLVCDLQKAVKVEYIDGVLFSQDNQANQINVTVLDGGEPATISGTVSANIIRSDGGTVAASGGSITGNVASITLPAAAYAVPGVVSIVVKLTASGVITTIAAIVANMYRASTDTAIDPGTVIPSIQTLISQINAAVASIPADYSSLWTKLAPAFSTDASYVAGQYVTYNSGLYRFNTTHTGGWSSSDVTAVNLGGEITDLKSAFNVSQEISFTITDGGYIDKTDGTVHSNSSYSYTNYIDVIPGANIRITTNVAGNAIIGLYDRYKKYIGYVEGSANEVKDFNIQLSNDVRYIRSSCRTVNTSAFKIVQSVISSLINLKNRVNYLVYDIVYYDGGINATTGEDDTTSNRVRTNVITFDHDMSVSITNKNSKEINENDYIQYRILVYNSSGTYQPSAISGWIADTRYNVDLNANYRYRLLLAHIVNGSTSTLNITDYATELAGIMIARYQVKAEDEKTEKSNIDNLLKLQPSNNLFTGADLVWENGNINTDGSIPSLTATNRVRTGYFRSNGDFILNVVNKESKEASETDYIETQLYEYNSSKVFQKYYSYSKAQKELNPFNFVEGYYYRLVLRHIVNGSQVNINITDDAALIAKISVVKADQVINNITNVTEFKYHNGILKSTAHQGYHDGTTNVANTAEAVKAAALYGFDICQFNVLFTGDGVPVLEHDDEIFVDTTTKIIGGGSTSFRISEHTYAELNEYSFSNGQKIPKLDDVLSICKTYGIPPYILAGGMVAANLETVINLVKKYCLEEKVIFAGGYAENALEYISDADVSIVLWEIVDVETDFIASDGEYHWAYEHAQSGKNVWINVPFAYSGFVGTVEQKIAFLSALHGAKLKTMVGVFHDDTAATYKTYAPYCDSIMSNVYKATDVYT